jgi:serine/threonine protein phosphatase PrpC
MSSRVLVPIINAGAIMSLAMSRSFGDALAKAVGVIVDPTIDVLRIAELRKHYKGGLGNDGTILLDHDENESIQMFAVSVSDGLFDKVPIEEIAQYLAVALESDDNGGSLYKACEELITKSSNIWLEKSSMFGQSYRDDISIAVHRL